MPLLGFQKQFADAVERGEKRQTIRAYRKDGRDPKPGETLYLYTGLRQKGARKLGEVKCKSVHRIRLHARGYDMTVSGSWLGDEAVQCIAEADGFADHHEMFRWFEKTHGLPFKGLLIRW